MSWPRRRLSQIDNGDPEWHSHSCYTSRWLTAVMDEMHPTVWLRDGRERATHLWFGAQHIVPLFNLLANLLSCLCVYRGPSGLAERLLGVSTGVGTAAGSTISKPFFMPSKNKVTIFVTSQFFLSDYVALRKSRIWPHRDKPTFLRYCHVGRAMPLLVVQSLEHT